MSFDELAKDHSCFRVKYVVKGEHTLGFIRETHPKFMEVLKGSVVRGGHDWKNGSVCFSPGEIRPATLADFDAYRVHPPPNFEVIYLPPRG